MFIKKVFRIEYFMGALSNVQIIFVRQQNVLAYNRDVGLKTEASNCECMTITWSHNAKPYWMSVSFDYDYSLNHKHLDKCHKKWHNSKFIIVRTWVINRFRVCACICVRVCVCVYERNETKYTVTRSSANSTEVEWVAECLFAKLPAVLTFWEFCFRFSKMESSTGIECTFKRMGMQFVVELCKEQK